MNNGRLWCIVNPTVGIPLMLSAVALTSLTVHYAVLNNTTWIKDYWQGSAARSTATLDDSKTGSNVAVLGADGKAAFVVNVTPAEGAAGVKGGSFVVNVSPSAVTTADASVQRSQ